MALNVAWIGVVTLPRVYLPREMSLGWGCDGRETTPVYSQLLVTGLSMWIQHSLSLLRSTLMGEQFSLHLMFIGLLPHINLLWSYLYSLFMYVLSCLFTYLLVRRTTPTDLYPRKTLFSQTMYNFPLNSQKAITGTSMYSQSMNHRYLQYIHR